MGWGPSALYIVEHIDGRKVVDFRISDIVFERAEKGLLHPRTKICLQIRQRLEKELGEDPGFVYYDELKFTKVREIPAAAQRTPKMKPAAKTSQS